MEQKEMMMMKKKKARIKLIARDQDGLAATS